MFTVFLEAVMHSNRNNRWDAPEHFKVQRGPVSNIEMERAAAERRHRAMRNVGMW